MTFMLQTSLTDLLQLIIALASVHYAGAWVIRMRSWPLTISVMASAVASVLFYLALRLHLFMPAEMNLLASIRDLAMAIIIGSIPFAIRNTTGRLNK